MEARKEMSLEEAAREELQKMEGERKKYDEETKKLVRELNWFIEEYLGPLLAAEEMGGPVVGEMMDLDAEDLEAGFNARGKLKKGRAKKTDENEEGDKKQRRIDEIWGGAREDQEEGRERNGGKRKREGDEASAAGAEMRTLIEKLMNKSMDAGGDSSAAYVRIEKETAAARFLVRSKVAVFHPRDATRLRLVDFGRELDD